MNNHSQKPKIICVTGGKGGTGKTLIACNLATMFKNDGKKVLLIDGDVENPNTYLLFGAELKDKENVPFFKPRIIPEKCIKCGLCSKNCATHALLYIKDSIPIPILNVCSGCKLCYKICPSDAIEVGNKTIGWTYTTQAEGINIFVGELKPSEARSAAIVEYLLAKLDKILNKETTSYDIIVLDTAPGAHCDVEHLLNKADYVIPVTEPTRFGKLDLERIIKLINLLNKDSKVIINRSTLMGFKDQFFQELSSLNIDILGDIPLDNKIIESYCEGRALMAKNSKYKDSEGYRAFLKIFNQLKEWIS